MTGAESKQLKVGDRVCWGNTATDLGTVTGISWSEVIVVWDDGDSSSMNHNDMGQIQRVPIG
jgi:hypothetical protein